MYSFNSGREVVEALYGRELEDIFAVIASVSSKVQKTKRSREKTMPDRVLYSPRSLNQAYKAEFITRGWASQRVWCEYSNAYYTPEYAAEQPATRGAFREMDFIKNALGVEVQFGKYAFMVYNVAAKMTIFRNLGFIKAGVEIVPVKAFAQEMSSGVSYFEQFVWDLEQRGVSNIDVPVLILGVAADPPV